jgi:hypothetical protein
MMNNVLSKMVKICSGSKGIRYGIQDSRINHEYLNGKPLRRTAFTVQTGDSLLQFTTHFKTSEDGLNASLRAGLTLIPPNGKTYLIDAESKDLFFYESDNKPQLNGNGELGNPPSVMEIMKAYESEDHLEQLSQRTPEIIHLAETFNVFAETGKYPDLGTAALIHNVLATAPRIIWDSETGKALNDPIDKYLEAQASLTKLRKHEIFHKYASFLKFRLEEESFRRNYKDEKDFAMLIALPDEMIL